MQRLSNGERIAFSTNGDGTTDSHMQRNEAGLLLHIIYKN